MKAGKLPRDRPASLIDRALDAGVIDEAQADLMRRAEEARADAIQVDSFTLEEFVRGAVVPAGDERPVVETG